MSVVDWYKGFRKLALPVVGSCLLLSQVWGSYFGYTEPYRMARMSFPETGVIVELPVREGQEVREGEVLARLDYRVLQTELNIAMEQVRLRKLRFDKIQELWDAGHIAIEEFERTKADLYIDEEKARRIEAQIENRTLRAPFDAIVVEVKQELSESVSSASTHVLTVVQLDRLQVDIHMPPEHASQFRSGKETTLVLDGHEKVTAKVDFVSPVIDAASNTVRVKFSIPNDEGKFRSGVRSRLDTGMEAASVSRETGSRRLNRSQALTLSQQSGGKEMIDPIPESRRRRILQD